jgi:hypothetical protein
MLQDALQYNAAQINRGNKGIMVGKDDQPWMTIEIPKPPEIGPTQQKVDAILQGKVRIYVYAWARWRDSANDLDFCEWLQPPPTNIIDNTSLVWHICAG